MEFNPDWSHLITLIVSWLLGALGIGIPQVTPNRISNKEGK